ncbi:MAG TPA: 4a-hydroxytetrahydrobiopterin dehydratase [Sphingobacteriaceae bacterium]
MSWKIKNDQLVRDFEFKNFSEAWAFMTRVAFLAEKMDHHPEWTNVYNKVQIKLSTHSAGNISTEKDRSLAAEIDQLLG